MKKSSRKSSQIDLNALGKLQAQHFYDWNKPSYRSFVFEKQDKFHYVVLVIELNEIWDNGTKERPPTTIKSNDLFVQFAIENPTIAITKEKELEILLTILNDKQHKGYKVLTGKPAYKKHMEIEGYKEGVNVRALALYTGQRVADLQMYVLPYKSLKLLEEHFAQQLAVRVKDMEDTMLDPNELGAIKQQIELTLIGQTIEKVQRELQKGVQLASTGWKWQGLSNDEAEFAKKFLSWLRLRKLSIISSRESESDVLAPAIKNVVFVNLLNDEGKLLQSFLIKQYKCKKIQEIAMMLFALEKLGLLTENILNQFPQEQLAEIVGKTFKPMMKAKILTRQALNISKYRGNAQAYAAKIDTQADIIQAEFQRQKAL